MEGKQTCLPLHHASPQHILLISREAFEKKKTKQNKNKQQQNNKSCFPPSDAGSVKSKATDSGMAWLNILVLTRMVVTIGCLLACLTSQQHASVSQGRICSDSFTSSHSEIEVADPTFYLTQSQYTNTGPTSPSADPTMPGAWQGSHWSASF